jgi:hypothetical protein
MEAKKWFIRMLPDIVKLDLPEDWKSPVSQILKEDNSYIYRLNEEHQTWKMIANYFTETLDRKIIDVQVIQNINLWRRYQLEC